jgi:tetratricopeptide (TPR) repeat protein
MVRPSTRRLARAEVASLLLALLAWSACAPAVLRHAGPSGDPGAITPLAGAAEAVSLLGDTLVPPALPNDVRTEYLARYREAEEALARDPDDAEALIWMGRRTAYLGRYRSAIDIYTRALTLHPDDARLYRHRGHRYVSIRELDHAIADLRRAAELTAGQPDEVEPDGLPNALGIPTSTLQFNIWYHLGLAYYLKGEFEAAADAYAACARVSVHPDSKVATAYWRTMTLKRLGRFEEARSVLAGITPDMEVIESGGYLDLLLLHKGERSPEDLIGPAGAQATLASTTTGYGVGAWYLLEGDADTARSVFERVLSGASQWAAFGYIAAEAELARMSGA